MNDDAAPDQAPTVPAIPLRARQRHRARSKKGQSSRWLARQGLPSVIVEEVPLASATFQTAAPSTETPPPVASWEDDTHDFFQAGDSISPTTHEAHAVGAEPAALDLEALPVHAPRRGLAAIVIGAVALAGVLCFAAMLKPHAPAAAAAPVIAVVREPVVEAPPPPPPAAREVPPPEPVAMAEAPAVPAKELREKARVLLEHRQIADAIATADDATKAEPENAEGWLLLGAAQLEAGRAADAKESFRTCTHVSSTGPVGECRSFAR